VQISHGTMGGYDQALVFARLLGAGFRLIAVSRFGYLRSSLPNDLSPAAQADLFAALLDVLTIRRVALLGGSAGGPAAFQFAVHYPERCSALVVASSAIEAYQKADTLTRRFDEPHWSAQSL
jgi:2-hydroxy-6-oxonona-2,4-dienedioate hydrolase